VPLPLALVLVSLVFAPAPATASAATDRQSWVVPLPAGRTLSVAVTIGEIRVQGESRSDALIEVVRTAPTTAALARIPVTVNEGAEAVQVTAVQTDGGTDPAFVTDVTLRVPRHAVLQSVRVMEGRLALTSFAGTIGAAVMRGPISANDVEGTLRLETSIGHIDATRVRARSGGLIRLRTFNGDVRLSLAERPRNARVLALALNGTIESDVPLTMKETWGPRWGETTLGSGDPVISLDVVTGRIAIRVP
jgi:DUF4097 and DUF4098 domain-containing protein YvlB